MHTGNEHHANPNSSNQASDFAPANTTTFIPHVG